MIESIFKLIDEMDSFKKISLFLLTGLTALLIWFGYNFIQNYTLYTSWDSTPHVVKNTFPCNLVQIRKDYYLVSISFPLPDDLPDRVIQFTSSFWVNSVPSNADFKGLCQGLIEAVNSDEAETLLSPFLRNK